MELHEYVIRHPNATRPYTVPGQGNSTTPVWALKVKSGMPAVWRNRGLGTTIKAEADLCADLVEDLHIMAAKGRTEAKLFLDEIGILNTVSLADVRERFYRAQLEQPNWREDALLAEVMKAIKSPKLTTIVDEWAKSTDVKAKYVAQVRILFDQKGFVDDIGFFTLANIRALIQGDTRLRIAGLDVGTETKKRYVVAVRALGEYLVARGFFLVNVISRKGIKLKYNDIEEAQREDVERYSDEEVKTMLSKCEPGSAMEALIALLYGAGTEMGAVEIMQKKDFDKGGLPIVKLFPPGRALEEGMVSSYGDLKNAKTKYRARSVQIANPEMWEIVRRYVASLPKGTSYFWPRNGLGQFQVDERRRKEFAAILRASSIAKPKQPFHSFRHSFAMYWIDRGLFVGQCLPKDDRWLKDQLGHAQDSVLIYTTYGRAKKNSTLQQSVAADVKEWAKRETGLKLLVNA